MRRCIVPRTRTFSSFVSQWLGRKWPTTSASEGWRLVARRDAWTPDPALAGRRQMTRWDSTRLTITSRRVAVALPSVAPPPLALAALVLPGIGGGGAGGEHQCCCA